MIIIALIILGSAGLAVLAVVIALIVRGRSQSQSEIMIGNELKYPSEIDESSKDRYEREIERLGYY